MEPPTSTYRAYHHLSDVAIQDLFDGDDESDVEDDSDDITMDIIPHAPITERDYLVASAAVLNNVGALYHERTGADPEVAMEYYRESLKMQIRAAGGDCDGTEEEEQQQRPHDFLEGERLKRLFLEARRLESSLIREREVDANDPTRRLVDTMATHQGHQGTNLMGMNHVFAPLRMEGKADRSITPFNISLLHHTVGNFDQTIALLHLAVDSLSSSSSSPYLAASISTNLGYVHYQRGQYEQALDHFQDALESATEAYIYEDDKTVTELRPRMLRFVVAALLNLARTQDSCNCPGEAMITCNEAEEFLRSADPGSSIAQQPGLLADNTCNDACFDVSALVYVKACIHHHVGDCAEARRLYQQFLRESRARLGVRHPRVAAALQGLGMLCLKFGNPQDAMEPLLAALDIRRRIYGEEHSEVADTLHVLGRTLQDRGELGDALETYKKALTIRHALLGWDHPSTIQPACEVARIHLLRGELDDALAVCRDLLRVSRDRLGPDHEFVAYVFSIMGSTFQDMGSKRRANMAFLEAFKIHQDANRFTSELRCVRRIACFRKENHDAAAA